jgi:hypothetical protein
MKSINLLFSSIIITSMLSCNKNTPTPDINGKWQLSVSYGGIVGILNHPKENGTYYLFKDHSYESYRNAELEKKGQYRVVNSVNKEFGQPEKVVLFDGEEFDDSHKCTVDIEGGTLAFSVVMGQRMTNVFKRQ